MRTHQPAALNCSCSSIHRFCAALHVASTMSHKTADGEAERRVQTDPVIDVRNVVDENG
jgi:hypothetical protein